MTYETAHKILSAHQAWQRGLVDALEYTAAEVNDALKFAIAALQSDPYAPDWSKAPWANYYGIDGDGSRWFYEKKPRVVGLSYDHNTGDFTKDEELGRMKLLKRLKQ